MVNESMMWGGTLWIGRLVDHRLFPAGASTASYPADHTPHNRDVVCLFRARPREGPASLRSGAGFAAQSSTKQPC
jgi:hypothetical protein